MKIIRPEQPIKKKEEITLEDVLIYQAKKEEEEIIGDNTDKNKTIENLMDDIITEKTTLLNDKYQVTVYLTERQYNLWKKKGGEKWLKRALVGQKLPKKR